MRKRELFKRLKVFILSFVVMSGAVSAPSLAAAAGEAGDGKTVGYEHVMVDTDGGQTENPHWELAMEE